jgi:hypothetical protein
MLHRFPVSDNSISTLDSFKAASIILNNTDYPAAIPAAGKRKPRSITEINLPGVICYVKKPPFGNKSIKKDKKQI